MQRILHIVDSMGMGGIQAFIMNVYRSIDHTKYQFDFLLHHKMKDSYDDEIIKLGGKIYYLPARGDGILKNRKALDDFFELHKEYKVVHQHESSLTYIEPLLAAKKNGVEVRIIHAHSTRASGSFVHNILHKINKKIAYVATNYFACGELAGHWMYDGTGVEKDVIIINNGINTAQFRYNETIRKEYRKKYNLQNSFVIGNVGRFSEVKNHQFLIEIFYQYLKMNSNAKLVLVGDGELFEDVKQQVAELNIEKEVMFLGVQRHIAELEQMFDYMIIPSLYEGFPVTAIEAQAAGVPCLISDSITKDVLINENVKMISLKKEALKWAEAIDKSETRIVDNSRLIQGGFDIKDTVNRVVSIYEKGTVNP